MWALQIDLTGGPSFVFDRDNSLGGLTNGNFGEDLYPGSGLGIDYTFASETGGVHSVDVTYSNIVQFIGTNDACAGTGYAAKTTGSGCGDTFGKISFVFTGGTTLVGGSWVFFQDTDQVGVPEPATLAFVSAGLVALILSRKRFGAKAV